VAENEVLQAHFIHVANSTLDDLQVTKGNQNRSADLMHADKMHESSAAAYLALSSRLRGCKQAQSGQLAAFLPVHSAASQCAPAAYLLDSVLHSVN
jgi:hypothetical protein